MTVSAIERERAAVARRRRYAGLPPFDTIKRRVRELADEATLDQRHDALHWYPQFHGVAETLAERFEISTNEAAGVLAILSPRVTVARSVWLAREMLSARQFGVDVAWIPGMTSRLLAAEAYLDGDPAPLALDAEGASESRKIRSFWRNITGDTDAVTVDSWITRAVGCSGDVLNKGPRGGAYIAIAEAFRDVAAERHIEPRELQALVWLVARDEPDDGFAELNRIARAPGPVGGVAAGLYEEGFETPV